MKATIKIIANSVIVPVFVDREDGSTEETERFLSRNDMFHGDIERSVDFDNVNRRIDVFMVTRGAETIVLPASAVIVR